MSKYVFSFGGGATSFLGALLAIEQYGFDNVDVINAALIDDEPYIKPVIDAFERVSGKTVTRLSAHSERLHYTKRAVDDAYAGNLEPQMLRWLLERINASTDGSLVAQAVDEPLYSTWHVDFMTRFMSNTMFDPCSSNLKRKPIGEYIRTQYPAGSATIGVAMTADEIDRTLSVTKRWKQSGYEVSYPLIDDNRYSDKDFVRGEFERIAEFVPTAYQMDLEHNNCTPCRKGGKAHHARTLYHRRDAYLWSERHERLWRETFQKDNAILREVRDGVKHYITLEQFRQEMEARWAGRMFEPFEGLEETAACSFCEAAA